MYILVASNETLKLLFRLFDAWSYIPRFSASILFNVAIKPTKSNEISTHKISSPDSQRTACYLIG